MTELNALSRYLVFAGSNYYPSGGWEDFERSFDDRDAAVSFAKSLNRDWWDVVDSNISDFVARGTSDKEIE